MSGEGSPTASHLRKPHSKGPSMVTEAKPALNMSADRPGVLAEEQRAVAPASSHLRRIAGWIRQVALGGLCAGVRARVWAFWCV